MSYQKHMLSPQDEESIWQNQNKKTGLPNFSCRNLSLAQKKLIGQNFNCLSHMTKSKQKYWVASFFMQKF